MDGSAREKVDIDVDTESEEGVKVEFERDGRNDGTFCGGEHQDVAYRHRYFHTACVAFSMFALGLRNALIGPTLPDLRLIVDEDLSTVSWIFTAKSLGGLIGAICGGFAYDRYNKIRVFILFVFCMGVVAGVTPWCDHIAAMLTVHALHGVFAAALETASTADVSLLWKERAGPFMQAVQFAFSVGAIVSPLLCEPFLAEEVTVTRTLQSPDINLPLLQSTTPNIEDIRSNVTRNQTDMIFNTTYLVNGTSRIYIPYSFVAFVCLLSVCLYVIICLLYGNVYRKCYNRRYGANIAIARDKINLSHRVKIFFTILLALTQLFYVVTEHTFIGFLMTFVVSDLNWSKGDGSTASSYFWIASTASSYFWIASTASSYFWIASTASSYFWIASTASSYFWIASTASSYFWIASTASSYFWIAFAVGRLSGIFIVKCISLSAVIVSFLSVLTAGAILFLCAVIFDINVLVWISVAVIGYGMSVIFSSLFSWLSQNVRTLTGKMTSIFFIFMCTGNMVVPLLVGYLMDKLSQMWFIYSCLTLTGAMFVCFITAVAALNKLKK